MGSTFIVSLLLFAADGAEKPGPGGSFLGGMLVPFLMIGIIFYFLLIRPQQKEQRRRREMLAAVKENDMVITTGGIYGVVTNVHTKVDEITIEVDEVTNTKLRMTRGSIARVVVVGDETSNGKS